MRQLSPDPTVIRLCMCLGLTAMMMLPLTCAAQSEPSETTSVAGAPTPQTGIASWHRGTSRTASGRRWRGEELIAAHRTLPLGSAVRVINVRNGRDAVVLITDRGPYSRGRIIDLSEAAARQIGCLEAGTASVRLEVVRLARFTRIVSARIDLAPRQFHPVPG